MSKQKTKGSSLERYAADVLTNVFGVPFSRSFGSGSFVGGKNQHRIQGLSKSVVNACKGDISCPVDHGWDFIIECKNYADLDFHNILNGYSNTLSGWLEEVRFDSEGKDNHALIFKVTRRGEYMAIPYFNSFSQRMADSDVSHHLYPHYFNNPDGSQGCRWYIILDFKILTGIYEAEYPQMLEVIKKNILYLAKELDNG